MDTLILLALPVFALSSLLELCALRRRALPGYELRDTLTSLAMGSGSVLIGLVFKLGFVVALTWLYEHRLFDPGKGAWAWLSLFLLEDLAYYWSHRLNHQIRLLWTGHVNHHSSQRYHFVTALRQSWTQPFTTFYFWFPLALLGFHPLMILAQQAISLVYQFFIHTTLVDRLGPLEWVLNTPSHHRVHHAVNPRYLDRNHGGILIIWDRLFGSFEAERAEEPPCYGLTTNIDTYNPLRVAFHEWGAMLRAVRQAPTLRQALGAVFAAPGWSEDGSTLTAAQIRLRAGP